MDPHSNDSTALTAAQTDPVVTPSSSELAASSTSFDTEADPTVVPTGGDEQLELDSTFGSPRNSLLSTYTIVPEIFNYPNEHGRTYHRYNEGKYHLPNDEHEQDRLDLQHHLYKLTLNSRLYLAPLQKCHRVLDICTGTGIWAIDFGDDHAWADVVGVDLSPIQPVYVPPNVRFQILDVEEDWKFSFLFDFVHWRMLFTCFRDPKQVIKTVFDSIAPGGMLELQDAVLPFRSDDGSLEDTDFKGWIDLLMDSALHEGRDWTCISKCKKYMEDVGFVDVEEVQFKWPMSEWPSEPHLKELGRWFRVDLYQGLEAFSMKLLTRRGMSPDEIQLLLVGVRRDLRNRHIHAYLPIVVLHGRKP